MVDLHFCSSMWTSKCPCVSSTFWKLTRGHRCPRLAQRVMRGGRGSQKRTCAGLQALAFGADCHRPCANWPRRRRIRVETLARTSSVADGPRFGILVHSLLAAIDFDAGPEVIRLAAALRESLLDATVKKIDAGCDRCRSSPRPPDYVACSGRSSTDTRPPRVPVLLRRVDGTLAEGVVTLPFPQQPQRSPAGCGGFQDRSRFEAGRANTLLRSALHRGNRKATNRPARDLAGRLTRFQPKPQGLRAQWWLSIIWTAAS